MSDYSSTYNGATKDATNATILASAIQTELDSISTAIATKADVAASPIANEIPITTSSGDLTNSGVYASGGAIRDSSGNEVIIPTGVASAINEVTVVNAATTANPRVRSSGEANTGLIIADSNDNEVIIAESVASAVNEITVTNAAAGNLPSINQTGAGDVGLTIEGVTVKNGAIIATSYTLVYSTSGVGSYVIGAPSTSSKLTAATSYTKLYEFITNCSGTVDVQFLMKLTTASGTGYGRIYVNGIAVGTERTTIIDTDTTYNEVITVAIGDLIQIYAKHSTGLSSTTISYPAVQVDSGLIPCFGTVGFS